MAASAVVLAGPNGTGKTSFFDAIQWSLLGAIERLENFRAKRTVEHIVNQYRLSKRASVGLDLVIRGRAVSIRRTGDHTGSTLEFKEVGQSSLFGAEAEEALRQALVPGGGLTLDMALGTSGLMQQDVMRAVLEAKPADRYRHISTVLGLGALEDFEDAARDLAKEAKAQADLARRERDGLARSLDEARARLTAAEQRLQSLPQVEATRDELADLLRRPPTGVVVDSDSGALAAGDVRALAASAASVIDSLQAFVTTWTAVESVRATLPDEPGAAAQESLTALLRAAEERVRRARDRDAAARSERDIAEAASAELARLAALAIPLLADECPVCSQPIDAAHVEEQLRRRAGETATMMAVRTAAAEAESELRAANDEEGGARSALASLTNAISAWDAFRAREAIGEEQLQALLRTVGHFRVAASQAKDVAQNASSVIEYLQAVRRRSLEVLRTTESAEDRGPVERAASEVTSFADALATRSQKVEEAAQRERLLKALADAAVESRVEVTEKRFKAVQPLVADIFSRLDPHPAFKTIEFELDTYYRKGTTSPLVRDLVEDVAADPLVVFSTSQANIAALSYFLAMGWSAGERGLPFVLLDDPVQSMDDVNVLGFADLCRHLRTSRQLLISTHEKRFARLIERKLAPRSGTYSAKVLDFVGWDRSGPVVQARQVDGQLGDETIRVVRPEAS